jgi:two-component system response regulator (stage 0 sporulation protein A)
MVLNAIKRDKPDVVVLNAVMPFFDASSIIHITNENRASAPHFIVLSDIEDVELKRENIEAGARDYLLKPFDNNLLFAKILHLISCAKNSNQKRILAGSSCATRYLSNISRTDLDLLVADIISGFGISPKIKGYSYLKEAVLFVFDKSTFGLSVTKDIYPAIAHSHDSTASCVERAIRHAIATAWPSMSKSIANNLVSPSFIARPTNSQLIYHIFNELSVAAQKFEVSQNCLESQRAFKSSAS